MITTMSVQVETRVPERLSADEQPRREIRKYRYTEYDVERFDNPGPGHERRRDDEQNRNDIEHEQGVPKSHPDESFAFV
jgi:hypothetical protein